MPLRCLVGSDEDSEECELYTARPEPYLDRNTSTEFLSRIPWLVGLLTFLTVSSAVLEYYDDLLQRHLVIAFYLTVLVGCGGNAGSQAAALVLQGLATGELRPSAAVIVRVLQKELFLALAIAATLSVGVSIRIVFFGGTSWDAATIATAMAITVVFSVVFGALAPLVLQRLGTDPAKVTGPLMSTVIDILGVVVVCVTAQVLEDVGYLR